MTVKLLQKSEIANLKAKQSSREVAEGVKIATRVDGLRELWSKTEQDFENYKTSTLAAIQKEIDAREKKKEVLTGELRQLQSKYDSLMPDISTKRTELAQFEKKLISWEKKLEKREDEAALSELDVADAMKKAEDARLRDEENERISRNVLFQANQKKSEAQNTLDTARKIQENAYRIKKETEDALALREFSIKAKESELLSKELLITNVQKELEVEKVRVNDMRETLLRSMQRLKEGRRP